jgi:prepilin-type processing-associated H-X9-DG protein/prepilin-type N-terminal cleavage/methylation domain-containing protein
MATFRTLRGVTLIEILISMAIIGLLVSLAMPAIQASRETSRLAQCTNNQRQFGVAFAGFEVQNKAFPSSFTLKLIGPLTTNPDLHLHNFMVDLLPFLEEQSISAQYRRDAFYCAPENAAAIGSVLQVAICPSAPRTDSTPTTTLVPSLMVSASARQMLKPMYDKLDVKYSLSYRGGVTDYSVPTQIEDGLGRRFGYDVAAGDNAGVPSMFPSPLDQPVPQLTSKIMAIWTSPGTSDFSRRTRAAQVTDGLTHTLMLAEASGRPDHYRMGERCFTGEPLESAWADPFIAFAVSGFDEGDGAKRCVMQCDNDDEIYSFHPAGANFLFADGHVAVFSADTEARLVLALVTPSGGDDHHGLQDGK